MTMDERLKEALDFSNLMITLDNQKRILKEQYQNNLMYYFNGSQFTVTQSLISCHGIITAGGFETPAEALYLKKKLLSIPILNHFEQECNGAAMQKLGVKVIKKIDKNFNQIFTEWIQTSNTIPFKLTHSTEEIVNLLMQQISYNQVA
jgi:uncharacterized protein (TIGR00661 family)